MPRQQRETMILDVAGTVFARGGYHDSSMDEIAALAEVSKPMLYAYFGSKEGLYVAYIDRTGRELVDRLLSAGSRSDDLASAFRHPITEFLTFVQEHREGWLVLFRELNSSRPLADEVADLRSQIAGAVERLICDGVAGRAQPAPHAVEGIAHAIVGAGESLANWWLEHPQIDREQVAGWYVGVVQAAVAAIVGTARSATPHRA